MLDAALKAVHYVQGRSRDDLDTDELLALGVVRLLEIIGEAARYVSQNVQQAHPHISWQQMADTRNRLIHGYFDVDFDIVWAIVTADLPPLITALEAIIPAEDG